MGDAPQKLPGRVYGYVRASTKKQEISPDVQREEIKRYCEYHRLAPPQFFVDQAVSAKRALETRPAGKQMLARLQKGDHVVCSKLDRMFRKQLDLLTNLERWERAGISLHITNFKGGAVDLSSPIGRFLVGIIGEVAQLERSYISERSRESHTERARQGYHKCGPAQLGFKLIRVKKGDRMRTIQVPDDKERDVMRMIVQWRVCDPPFGWNEIGRMLLAKGILNRQGTPWNQQRIRRAFKREMYLQLKEQGLLKPTPKPEEESNVK